MSKNNAIDDDDMDDDNTVQRFSDDLRKKIPKLRAVILFGSVARGKPGDSSDIDVLVVIDDEDPEKKYLSTVSQASIDTMGERELQSVITNLSDIDKSFLARVLREGRVIYGKVVVQGNKMLSPMKMICYTTSGSGDVSRISQIVHGYTTKKKVGNKEYVSNVKGIGWSPARGVVVLPEDKAKEFEKMLRKKKIKYMSYEIWR